MPSNKDNKTRTIYTRRHCPSCFWNKWRGAYSRLTGCSLIFIPEEMAPFALCPLPFAYYLENRFWKFSCSEWKISKARRVVFWRDGFSDKTKRNYQKKNLAAISKIGFRINFLKIKNYFFHCEHNWQPLMYSVKNCCDVRIRKIFSR